MFVMFGCLFDYFYFIFYRFFIALHAFSLLFVIIEDMQKDYELFNRLFDVYSKS